MNYRSWLPSSLVLAALVGAACGGRELEDDDLLDGAVPGDGPREVGDANRDTSADRGADGLGGSTGSGGTGGGGGFGGVGGSSGKGGSAGKGGSTGTGGAAGRGGGGAAGTTGTAGRGGMAGTAGRGGSGGSPDAGGKGGTGGAGRGGGGGSVDSGRDGVTDSGGPVDATLGDGPSSDVPRVDANQDDAPDDVSSGDASNDSPFIDVIPPTDAIGDAGCPAGEPVPGGSCTGDNVCSYRPTLLCMCSTITDGGRSWNCRLLPDGGSDPNCPASAPADGTSCSSIGAGTMCLYGGTACGCDGADIWRCTL